MAEKSQKENEKKWAEWGEYWIKLTHGKCLTVYINWKKVEEIDWAYTE